MELTVRDWMAVVGVLLILAILLDGYRRTRNNRSGKIWVPLVKVPEDGTDPDRLLSADELPSGGGRVINRPEEGDDISVLTDEADAGLQSSQTEAGELSGFSALEQSDDLDRVDEDGAVPPRSSTDAPASPPPVPLMSSAKKNVEDVIMLNVLARDEAGFAGGDLLQILLACDLRFGEANLFHRHEQANGHGSIQFSVANMLNPGVFDIDNMGGFSTPGITFFLSLPGPDQAMQVFDYMLETAQVVASNLEGNILDEARSVMTNQTIEHCRQRIRDFERKMLAQNAN